MGGHAHQNSTTMSQQTLTELDAEKAKRVQSAMDEQMDIEPLAGGNFEVKGKYEVDPDNKTCECPDYEHRDIECKHIVRVTLELMWENISRLDEQGRPPKPDVIEPDFEQVPRLLKSMDHWVCWEQKIHENKDGTQRWTKVPIDVHTGSFASSTDSDTWTDFETAKAYCQDDSNSTCGIGFCVNEDDALVGVDFDDCRDPVSGNIDETVKTALDHMATYAEVSPSGTGVRAFALGELTTESNQADLTDEAHIEVYEFGRYLTVTGQQIGPVGDVQWDETGIEMVEDMVRDD